MAYGNIKGRFKGMGTSVSEPSLGPIPMPADDTVDLDPTWRGFVVEQAGIVRFTGRNGETMQRSFPAGFTMDMWITRIDLTASTAIIFGLE